MKRRIAALVDQGLISATNFALFVYSARILPIETWGAFGFAYALVLFCQGFQRAIVVIPMITFSRSQIEWQSAASNWSSINAQFTAGVTVLLAAAGGVLYWSNPGWASDSTLTAAILIPTTFIMEFCKRAAVQYERFELLVLMALAYCTLTVSSMVFWYLAGPSSWMPATSMLVGGIGAICCFALMRPNRDARIVTNEVVFSNTHRNFSFWASLSHVGFSGYNFGVQALLGSLAGPIALGVFHACRTLLQPVNTLIGAMDTIDKPRATRAYATNGRVGLFGAMARAIMVLLVLGGTYILSAMAMDSWLLEQIYGVKYRGQESIVRWWCLVALLTMIAQPIESAMYVAGLPKQMFYSRMVSTLFSLACAYWLIPDLGPTGALGAMVVGYGFSAIAGLLLINRHA